MAAEPRPQSSRKRSDMALSLALPAAVIALGVALSVGSWPLAMLVDLCLEALR